MKWYLLGFRNYLRFRGRAVRKEFWIFMMFNLLFLITGMIIDNVTGITLENWPVGYVFLIYAAIIFIPALAVTIRRLHDVGKKARVLFLTLIPIIGIIWILSLLVTDSQTEENIFGASPLDNRGNKYAREFPSDTIILIVVGWMMLGRIFYLLTLKYIPDFLAAYERSRADMIIGSRTRDKADMPFDRRCSNFLTSRVLSILLGRYIEDSQSGYRLISTRLLKEISLRSERFQLETEIIIKAAQAGFKISFVPIKVIYGQEFPSSIHRFIDTLRWIQMVLEEI